MGHPITVYLKHDMSRVAVFRVDPRCDWPDCLNHVRWEVAPRHYSPDIGIAGNYFCTAHAKAVIKRIEKTMPNRPTPPGAPARADGGA